MKQTKNILIMAVVFTLLTAFPAFLYANTGHQADVAEPISPPFGSSEADYEIPPLVGGEPYPFPITSYIGPETADLASPDGPDAITINVWHGLTQNFGTPGTPQEWINILGNVSGPAPITSLVYSLNGGPDQPLSIGGIDKRRLYNPGDFNVEIHYTDLNDGSNTVVIKASDGSENANVSVTVNYAASNTIPLPYTVDWGSASVPTIFDGGQPVDGRWDILSGNLENLAPGYDRVYALGDMGWTDYEVTVPVTVTALNNSDWGPPSNGAGVGFAVRWQGHTPGAEDSQPLSNWRRIGAIAWYRWQPYGNVAGFQMLGYGGGQIAKADNIGAIELDKTYNMKVSVQSSGQTGVSATYRFKYWLQGTPEPLEWQMKSKGVWGEPINGSVLLIAHQAMVKFGDVTVNPLPSQPLTITVNQPANGEIFVTPSKANYTYGEQVAIRVQGDAGYGLKNWTGSLSGNKNPVIFDITKDITVGAVLESAPQPTLTVTTDGQGEVDIDPDKTSSSYFYGELVTLTAQPAAGQKFAGWSGDLTGLVNPITIVMDKSKNITAKFVLANTGSPLSDDFHSCTLNTGLWTFINPRGDGSYQTNGTQLILNVPADVSHNIWSDGNNSVRVMQPTQNNNFEIVAKFDSVVTKRFQMQGILVEQDEQNYLRFETYHNGTNVLMYAVGFTNNNPVVVVPNKTVTGTPPYLRVTRPDDQWSFWYSYDGENWEMAGEFTRSLNVTKSGVYGGNHGNPPTSQIPAHTAIIDYFFNTAAPIDPEDGAFDGGFTIDTNVVGDGSIDVNPQNPPYTCGQTVSVTAIPAPGWYFAGWSGDLSGAIPTQQLLISGNQEITATFTEEPVVIDYKVYLPMGVDN